MQVFVFLVAALWAFSAAEEATTEENAEISGTSETPKQPTLLAIIVPALDPIQSGDDIFDEPVYDDEDLEDEDTEDGEIMKTARNIVFRPLFTYRQKKLAKRRVQVRRNAARKSSARRNAQKRNAQPANKYYNYNRNSYYRPRYPSYYPSYYYNAQFPTIA